MSKVQLDTVPEDKPANNNQAQLLAYQKFITRNTKEIDNMIVKGLQDKHKRRLAAVEKDSSDVEDNCECLDFGNVEEEKNVEKVESNREVDKAYAALVNESVNSSECGPTLLLPAIIQPVDKMKVVISSTDSEIKDPVQAERYVKQVEEDRDAAFQTVRLLRNKVEELHSEKRKLYFEMNNKIDTIRKFWRNHLVEGDTRSGLCVKLAVQKVSNLSNS